MFTPKYKGSMDTDPKLEQIKNYIQAEFSPLKIYLFGSRAKGTSKADSDYDLVVISSNPSLGKWQAFEVLLQR